MKETNLRRALSLLELLIAMAVLAILILSIPFVVITSHKLTNQDFSIESNKSANSSSIEDAIIKVKTVSDFLSAIHTNNLCLTGNYTCLSKPQCCGIYKNDSSIQVFVQPFNGRKNLKLITIKVNYSKGNYILREVVGTWQ